MTMLDKSRLTPKDVRLTDAAVDSGNRHRPGKRGERFIMRIPLSWKVAVIHLSGQASAVGDFIWYLVGMKRSREVELSFKHMSEEFRLSVRTCRRGLLALEKAGLISIKRRRGRKSIVTVLVAPGTGRCSVGHEQAVPGARASF